MKIIRFAYGKVSSHWKKEGGQFHLDIETPANTTAKIYMPATNKETIKESGQPIASVKELKVVGSEGNYILIEAGSGSYHFTVTD